MKSKHFVIYILLFVMVAALSACATPTADSPSTADSDSASTSESSSDNSEADDSSDDDSGPESPLYSPLPEPEEVVAAEVVAEPEPEEAPVIEGEYDDETGAVTGVLRARHQDGDIRPLAGAVLGLGAVVRSNEDSDKSVAAAYGPADSPRATVNEDGTFSINNIPASVMVDDESVPAKYALILDAVVAQSLMAMPDDSGDFVITIEAGEQIDLGILEYESLPYPGFAAKE